MRMVFASPVIVITFAFGAGVASAQPPDKPAGPEDKEKLEVLQRHIRNLKSTFKEDRVRAAQELAKLGEAAKPAARALCEAAVEPNNKLAREALEALQKIWPQLHDDVVMILADKNPQKRATAIKDILLLEDGEAAVPVLLENLKRHLTVANDFGAADESVAFAIDALKRMAPKNVGVVNVLLTGASPTNSKSSHRILALGTLGELVEENPKAAPQIKRMLLAGMADRNSKVRIAALRSIGNLGKHAKDNATLTIIKKLKLDGDEDVRSAATETLDKLQSE